MKPASSTSLPGYKSAHKFVQSLIRRLGYVIAWNYPQLYLKLMVRWKLRNSYYYKLVQSCRAIQAEIPYGNSKTEICSGHSGKRILYVIHWYELGGAESYALYTIKTARELGYSCYCISTVPSDNKERPVFENYCVEALDYSKDKTDQGFRHFISNYIRDKSIDVVHIHHSALMYETLPAIKKEFPKLLIVDTTHIVEYGNGGFPQLSAQNSRHIDKHNVISKNLMLVQKAIFQEAHGESLDFKKFHLTYLSGLSVSDRTPPQVPKRHRKVITFYGRLVLQKQPNIFVATIESLIAQHPELNVEAHIYGEGEMLAALQSQVTRSKCHDRFRLLGRCDDKKKVFENSDILLLTSFNEGISLTAFEALSYNRLVISSDVGAQSELLCEECLVPLTPAFIEDAAARVFKFLTDRGSYTESLAKGIQKLEQIRRQEVNSVAVAKLYSIGL